MTRASRLGCCGLLGLLAACAPPPPPVDSARADPVPTDSAPTDPEPTDSVPSDPIDTTPIDVPAAGAVTLPALAPPTLGSQRATTLPVPTAGGLPEVVGFSVNAEVHPHGFPTTWYVEYGPTAAYGTTTPGRALPGRLDAWYREDWDEAVNGYAGGIGGVQLTHEDSGGPDGSGFVRYTDNATVGDDTNHYEGIGIIHLGLYSYIGHYDPGTAPPLYLGGGFPDLRGARLSLYLRGNGWEPHGTELGSWIQGYRDVSVVTLVPEDSRFPNWAYTGEPLTDRAASGAWEYVEWQLRNRTQDWTFAGSNGGRLLYDYGELESQLSHVNVDFFPIQILYVNLYDQPVGSLDYDQLTVNYRQHSVLAAFNGGSLVVSPGGTGAELLTDGWRNGPGHEWQSDPSPSDPQVFEYQLAEPVTLYSLTLHNATTDPSASFTVEVSEDDGATWAEVAVGELPRASAEGANFLFTHADVWTLVDGIATWSPLYPSPVNRLRVTLLTGHQTEAWALGEIEAFGVGATEATDDDWYDVNRDVLVDRGTWHYRVVATNAEGVTVGPDRVVEVP